MGGNTAGAAGREAGAGSPALRMVAIGCWAKFKFGGGFAVGKYGFRGAEVLVIRTTYYPQIVLEKEP